MKGLSPLIATVFVILISFVSITIAILVAQPVYNQAKDSAIINEATNNMLALDNAIKEVASEAVGSQRSVIIQVSDGSLTVNPDANTMQFDIDTKAGVVAPGTIYKKGNLVTIGGKGAIARDNSTHFILENEILQVVLQKVGVSNSTVTVLAGINSSQNIQFIGIKNPPVNMTVYDSSIVIENVTNSSWGLGFSKLVATGSGLPQAEALYFISSNYSDANYEVHYILPSGADFLLINVLNTTGNKTTAVLNYRLGSTSTNDYVKIPSQVDKFLNETICHNTSSIVNYYVCTYDNSSELVQPAFTGLIYSGSPTKFVQACYVNSSLNTYKINISSSGELKAIFPFALGSCTTLDNKYYLIKNQEIPAESFNNSYATSGSGTIHVGMVLSYSKIRIEGLSTGFGKGQIKVCIQKAKEERGTAILNVTKC